MYLSIVNVWENRGQHFGLFISKLTPDILSIFHRIHADAVPLDPLPLQRADTWEAHLSPRT
jgi:hypothetical protein